MYFIVACCFFMQNIVCPCASACSAPCTCKFDLFFNGCDLWCTQGEVYLNILIILSQLSVVLPSLYLTIQHFDLWLYQTTLPNFNFLPQLCFMSLPIRDNALEILTKDACFHRGSQNTKDSHSQFSKSRSSNKY